MKRLVAIIISTFLCAMVLGQNWTTQSDGDWEDASTWLNNGAPTLVTPAFDPIDANTQIRISHKILLNPSSGNDVEIPSSSSITILTGGKLLMGQIGMNGSGTGAGNVTVESGATFIPYQIVTTDQINLTIRPGGCSAIKGRVDIGSGGNFNVDGEMSADDIVINGGVVNVTGAGKLTIEDSLMTYSGTFANNSFTDVLYTHNYGGSFVMNGNYMVMYKGNVSCNKNCGATSHECSNGDCTESNYDLSAFCDRTTLINELTQSLPVELQSFNGVLQGGQAQLSWLCLSEKNNDYFTVERSDDGKSYNQIGSIDGSGNSTLMKEYTFIDTDPMNGGNYYRLVQYDYDGTRKVLRSVYLNNTNADYEFIVYPSAVKRGQNIQVRIHPDDIDATLSIVDGVGNEVNSVVTVADEVMYEIPAPKSAGIYIIEKINNKGVKYMRIIVE